MATSENDHPFPIALNWFPLLTAFFISHMKFAVVALYLSDELIFDDGNTNLKEVSFANRCVKFSCPFVQRSIGQGKIPSGRKAFDTGIILS